MVRRQPPWRCTIASVNPNRIPAVLAAAVLVACLAVLVPYLVAASLPPENAIFAGFLLNPTDGFSYLAKMRQGYAGGWYFQLPYSHSPGYGAFLFTFYLALGHAARLVGAPLLLMFHGARVIMAGLFFSLAGWLALKIQPQRVAGRFSLAWLTFGSGLGWLGIAAGVLGSDIAIPESVPFTAAFANAHFPAALALMVAGAAAIVSQARTPTKLAIVFACGVLLTVVLPFAAISLAIAIGLWWIWEAVLSMRAGQGIDELLRSWRTLVAVAFGLGALPLLLYDLWLTQRHPVLGAWHAQNLTPSPGLAAYLIGFGPVLLTAALGVYLRRRDLGSDRRLFVAWAVSGLLLLYAPFGLQRRLTLGLFVPLALLAGDTYRRWADGHRWRSLLIVGVLLLTIPSNLLVVGAGLSQVGAGQELLLYQPGELEGYRWVQENTAGDDLVLAAPLTGNRLPAFARVQVLYGHPFETPNAEKMRSLVVDVFTAGSERLEPGDLAEFEIDYIFYGPHERALGEPAWLDEFELEFQSQSVMIFRFPR